jgi:GTP-binding protein
VHVVDVSDDARDPLDALSVVEGELQAFDPGLLDRPRVIAANKIDLPHGSHLAALSAHCIERGIRLFPISAVTGEGVERLVKYLADGLKAVQGSEFIVQSRELKGLSAKKL